MSIEIVVTNPDNQPLDALFSGETSIDIEGCRISQPSQGGRPADQVTIVTLLVDTMNATAASLLAAAIYDAIKDRISTVRIDGTKCDADKTAIESALSEKASDIQSSATTPPLNGADGGEPSEDSK